MGKRYMAVRGVWGCGALKLRSNRYFEIGVGDLPSGYESWEQIERLLDGHPDKNVLYYEVPVVEELRAVEAAKEEAPEEGAVDVVSIYACPYCGHRAPSIDKLRAHMDECQDLVSTGHFENADAGRVEPLSVPDEAEEKAAGEAEAKIREEQAEAEAKAKAEKKEKNAKTYGKKSGGLSAQVKNARKSSTKAAKEKKNEGK